MTDKQIIIDGVDVSGCEWYSSTSYFKPCNGCKNTPNCYYKQLAREKQECKENQKTAQDAISKLCAEKSALHNELDQLKVENDELKNEIKHYKQIAQYHGNLSVKYTNKSAKLKQTLTEIKEIADWKNEYWSLGIDDYKNMADEILQKISEVEND